MLDYELQKPFPHRFILFRLSYLLYIIYIYIFFFLIVYIHIGLERIPPIGANDRKH